MILSESVPKSIFSKKKIRLKCDSCGCEYESRYDRVCINFDNHKKNICNKCSKKISGERRKGKARDPKTIEKARQSLIKKHKEKHPNFTLYCKFCNNEFIVPYGERARLYCGRSCQSKAIVRSEIKSTSECIVCKEEFKHYGERILCSRECNAKYASITRIGENNPSFIKDKETKDCLSCGKEFEYTRSNLHEGQTRVFCSLACAHEIDLKGNAQSNRIDPYPTEFNESFKAKIRERDGFLCQMCGKEQTSSKHHVHHIDYDKHNLDEDNLITLCQTCHNATHHGRTFWELIFSGIISGSKLVQKPWGGEIHIANHNDYCLKYLIFFKDKQFSYHTHKVKKELWHCVYGKFECVLGNEDKKDYLVFKQGDKIEIEPDVVHQLQALKNSILVEVSTRDFPEDSIRLIKGIN